MIEYIHYTFTQTKEPVVMSWLSLIKNIEVARLNHSFERGLERITANYSLREDGGVSVVNRGYSIEDDEWSVAEGKAYFVNDEKEGYLKVSLFGPF